MSAVPRTAGPAGAKVIVQGLARRFGPRWALAGVAFEVPAGGSLLLTGANGSGKSTLLRCLATALRYHRGTIALDGVPLWPNRRTLRGDIRFLAHDSRVYADLSAADNIDVWARLAGVTVDPAALLERVGLPTNRVDPVRTFSAGMRRRLALALTLLDRPRLALLDEPFASLDVDGRALITGVVRELRDAGVTVVIATHLPEHARPLCDAALHLDAGRIASPVVPA